MATKRKLDQQEPPFSEPEPEPQHHQLNSQEQQEEHEEQELEEENLSTLLEPLTKDQLISLLTTATTRDPTLLTDITTLADKDPTRRKIFVHGLGWDTDAGKLRSHFSIYGEIEDCNVVLDKATGKSKGYGFLLFRRRSDARKALRQPQKLIDNRMTSCQLASAGPPGGGAALPPPPVSETLARKIYVGNVSSEIPADKLFSFFQKFGEIEEGPLGFDKHTGKSRGFALFIYRTLEGAKKALEEPTKSLDGRQLYCQKATENHKVRTGGAAAAEMATVQPPPAAGGGLLGQGMGLGFNQGLAQNQALAVLAAAAGQNPAGFGMNPALALFMNGGGVAAPNGLQHGGGGGYQNYGGYGGQHGMGNVGYQNAGYVGNFDPSQQGGVNGMGYNVNGQLGQQVMPRPQSNGGHMGGYAAQ